MELTMMEKWTDMLIPKLMGFPVSMCMQVVSLMVYWLPWQCTKNTKSSYIYLYHSNSQEYDDIGTTMLGAVTIYIQ